VTGERCYDALADFAVPATVSLLGRPVGGVPARLETTVGPMSIDDYNPFAAPESGREFVKPETTSDEAVRRQHMVCEQNIHSIAGLMILGGLLAALGSFVFAFVFAVVFPVSTNFAGTFLAGSCGVLAAGHLIVSVGLFRLRAWARPWAILISALWLFAFPFGTLIAVGAIFMLVRPAASVVLTDDYKQLITRTPHIRLKTSITSLVFGLFGLIGLTGLIGIVLLFLLI